MRFIDFHTHVYPDAIAHKAAESVRAFYNLGNEAMDGTVDMLLQLGDAAGTNQYVILPVSNRPDRTRHINDFILQTLEKLYNDFTMRPGECKALDFAINFIKENK